MSLQLYEPTAGAHDSARSKNASDQAFIKNPNPVIENAITHILVAVRLDQQDREAVILALRMAATHRARVTLLHVIAPYQPPSPHWLDAIDNLHRALSGQPRHQASAIQKGRSDISAFVDHEIPRELLQPLDLHVECRVGDVATEIARFADEQCVDLVFLCDRPSKWRPSILSGLSQRIVQLNSKPIVFARPQSK